MDYKNLENQIWRLRDLAEQATRGALTWKAVWELIKDIGSRFKETQFPTLEAKNEAWSKFQTIVDTVKDEQGRQGQEADRKTAILQERITGLESAIDKARKKSLPWKEVWFEIKNIGKIFKATHFNSKQSRETLWNKFQELIDETKDFQAAEQREWEGRSNASERLRDKIIARAEAARPLSDLESTIADMILLIPRIITEIATLGLLKTEVDERKGELQSCSRILKEAWGLLNEHKNEMLGRDKHAAFQKVQQVQEELNSAWDAWRRLQGQYHEANKAAWRDRVEGTIEKLKSRLQNLYSILARREDHLAELQEKRDSAWNDDFRDRVEGWIYEEQQKIEEIKSQIRDVEGWLVEERNRL